MIICIRLHGLLVASVLGSTALGLTGCGDGRFEVAGTVSRSGRPIELPDCRITFIQPDKGIFAPATLDAAGKYRVKSYDTSGLQPGTYEVVVSFPPEWLPPTKSATEAFPPDELERRIGKFIPKKYRDPKTSGLTLEVKDQDIEFNVDMTD